MDDKVGRSLLIYLPCKSVFASHPFALGRKNLFYNITSTAIAAAKRTNIGTDITTLDPIKLTLNYQLSTTPLTLPFRGLGRLHFFILSFFELRSSLLTFGKADASIAGLSLNRSLQFFTGSSPVKILSASEWAGVSSRSPLLP